MIDLSAGCSDPRDLFVGLSCGHLDHLVVGCHARWDYMCPVCAEKWRRGTRARYAMLIRNMDRPSLVTLTLVKDGGVEERLLSMWELRKYFFKVLRRRGYDIRSWCGVVEPPNHIHMIVDMDYIPQHEMSEIWHRITGDSYVVDVRALDNSGRGVKYISKYITKISNWGGLNLDMLEGFHIIGSYGGCPDPRPDAVHICAICGLPGTYRRISGEQYWACSDDYHISCTDMYEHG